MRRPGVDVLMITYNRPEYTRLSLERLLTSAPEEMRVWLDGERSVKAGKHKYSLEEFGLSEERVAKEMAFYSERFEK